MKAVDANLLDLLKVTNQFEVPIYQRAYAWTEEECAQLWKDILRAGSSERHGAHFTGSVVYVDKASGTATSQAAKLIIDGQQRVTTVTLILTALASRLEQLPEDEQEPVDGFSPQKIRRRYLLNDDEDGERRFKMLLSQRDKDALIAIVQGEPPRGANASRTIDNFAFFEERLRDRNLDLAVVCRGLARLTVVDIQLQIGVDQPQLVFEAMNSTGKKLSQTDLIRNFVLMDLPAREQEDLYTRYWRPMELDFGETAYETQFDDFVRHFLTIATGSIPRVDDVYEAFKDHAAVHFEAGNTIQSLVIDLRNYAWRYCAIALGKEPDAVLGRAFKDLDQIKADVVYPFLLEVYTDYQLGTITKVDILEIVEMVTSYIFRRAVVRIPTNSLNLTFARFGRTLHKDRYVESVKANFLRMEGYRRFPTDLEFAEKLQTEDFYNFKRRSYFFRILENIGRKERVSIEDYTIEHILPQNPDLRQEWRSALGDDWEEIQNRYLHTLGNLTLTGYNSEYSDRTFREKRDMPGGFKESPLRLNVGLGTTDVWNAATIEERAARLAQEAVQIWKRPELPDAVVTHYRAPRAEADYTIEQHPHLLPHARRELFDRFASEVLALDPSVTRTFLKQYVAFKAETNFVDVIPQAARMRLSLNMPFEALQDDRGIAYDVSAKGHWGNGTPEVTLNEESDFAYVIGLVRQAYEYQIGEE